MLNDGKESFIVDTSAFISLETADLFDEVLTNFNIITTPSSIEELNQFARHDDELGKKARFILKHKDKLSIKRAELREQIPFLEETDNELYNLAMMENFPLITDDHRLNHHTRKKITVYFSTFFLMYFALMEEITKGQALEKLEILRELRNWHNNIMYLRTRKGLEQLKD